MNRVHFLFPFILLSSVIFALENAETALCLVLAMAVHEAGHIIVIKISGGSIYKTYSSSVGANISFTYSNLSRRQEIAVYAAGPCAGALAGMIGELLGFHNFSKVSFYLSFLNMLPSVPFDGGGIVQAAFLCSSSNTIIRLLSIVTGTLLCVIGLYYIKNGGNFTIFASGIGVFISLAGKTSLQ